MPQRTKIDCDRLMNGQKLNKVLLKDSVPRKKTNLNDVLGITLYQVTVYFKIQILAVRKNENQAKKRYTGKTKRKQIKKYYLCVDLQKRKLFIKPPWSECS